MKKEDIAHLATLARIELTESEMTGLESELSSIVSYVSEISEITADATDAKPEVGARYNVFRKDEITNEPDQFTKDILAQMPQREDRYLSVKKILNTDE